MFVSELIDEAIRKGGFNNVNNPAIRNKASESLKQGVRKYSSDQYFPAFQKSVDVTLSDGTFTIGVPVLKKGLNLHWVSDADELPNIEGYNPETNTFGYVMDVDYFMVGNYKGLVTIVENSGEYEWGWVYDPAMSIGTGDMVKRNPDVWIGNFNSVISIVGKFGTWEPINLTQWKCWHPSESYVLSTTMGKYCDITSKGGEVCVIYNESINPNDVEEINLPEPYLNLLTLYVAYQVCENVEEKEMLANELQNMADTISMQNAAYDVCAMLRE